MRASVVARFGGGAESLCEVKHFCVEHERVSNQARGLPDLGLTINRFDRDELGPSRLELDNGLTRSARHAWRNFSGENTVPRARMK